MKHTGTILAEMLAGYGVHYIFGVPGGQTNALYDAVGARSDVHHILMRDERSAAYAAVGYAKISNKIGVCDATVGAGSTKLTSGLAEAYNMKGMKRDAVKHYQRYLDILPDGPDASVARRMLEVLEGS